MADSNSNTLKNLQNVANEVEAMEFERPWENCRAHIRQQLLEVLYKADELLECLVADSADALPPLKLKPTAGSPPNERTRKKKGNE